MSGVFEDLSEEECYLYALFQDYSGIDIAEFCLVDEEFEDGLVRAFPMQYAWWRNGDKHQIDAGSRSAGKALDVNTPILTTAGWKVMGSVVVGDFVFNETGNPVEVLEVFDTLYDRDCYEVSFSDGSTIVADGEHFWKTCTKRGEVNKVATTLEIKDTLTLWGEANHRIPVAMPLQYPEKELLVEPYGLGYWLGDGSSQSGYLHIGEHDVDAVTNLCSEIGLTLQKLAGGVSVYAIKLLEQGWTELPVLADEGILPPRGRLTNGQVKECRRLAMNGVSYDDLVAIYGVSKTSICEYVLGQQRREAGGPIRPPRRDLYASHLEEIGVLKNKHIPDRYMTASFRQRLALLQGIMDSDGHIRKNGSCEISLSNFRLAEDVYKLLLTLGQKPAIRTKQTRCNGNPSNPTRRITFTPINGVVPFRLPRKVERVKLSGSPRAAKRSIWDVRQVPSRPVRCIRVSGDSHLFLAGASLIPTHNSMSIRYRAVAFPFIHPGAEMLITAPESVHLQAITSKIENIYLNNRIPREMLASRGNTPRIQQRPTWNMTFMNGGSIKGRIPQRDGKGVKGMHPTWLEADEMQDFPEAGWVELSSTLAKVDGAAWRCHGVTRGVGGTFDKYCSPGSGWTVHRLPAMLRPTWDDEERAEAVMKYGSEENIDFRRNILGLPGDSTAALFVLSRLVRCVDQDSSNDYNDGIYQLLKIDDAMIEDAGDPLYLIDPPGSHAAFDKTWIGMDVGWCVDTETEILTKRGWLSYDKLLVGDESLSIDPATGLSDWQTVTDIYSDTGLYAMAHMSADNFDAVTTLHHRWLVGVSGGGGLRWTTTEGLCSGDCVPSLSSFSGTNWIPLSDMNSFVDRKLRTIWCPTMANHQNWLARRNGSVYFTGNTTSPSAITVFAEEKNPDKSKESILRLISRILLTRVSGPDQVRIVAHLIDLYRPKAFAMDSTGAGQPLVQFLQEAVRDDPSLAHILDRIKGYNFSSNIVVDIDETKEMDQIEAMKADPSLKEMEVRRNVKEYSSDVLRELVDQGRLILPWDKDLIGEFQGETWGYSKKIIDHYGRRKIYSGTGVHSLDAARLGALAYKQQFIDEILDNHKNQWEPSPLIFL